MITTIKPCYFGVFYVKSSIEVSDILRPGKQEPNQDALLPGQGHHLQR